MMEISDGKKIFWRGFLTRISDGKFVTKSSDEKVWQKILTENLWWRKKIFDEEKNQFFLTKTKRKYDKDRREEKIYQRRWNWDFDKDEKNSLLRKIWRRWKKIISCKNEKNSDENEKNRTKMKKILTKMEKNSYENEKKFLEDKNFKIKYFFFKENKNKYVNK